MRVLISIGCDAYASLKRLSGAENDASAVYEHLVANAWGDYDAAKSKLLLSPTIADVRSAVESVLFAGEVIEELTLFFAGHGGVKDGSYFLCLRDTDGDRMSLSALSMTQLFAWITEARVGHTNLMIDACQSGGVVHDIGVLLNPNVIGKVGSMAISILAASGSDEYAMESGGAGLCTTALLSCLKGDIAVQTTRPSLDLVEVGQVVSRSLQEKQQNPVCWGINLFGISQLAKNPCYSGGNAHIIKPLSGLISDSAANESIRSASDDIWEQYLLASREFDADRFLEVIQPICSKLEGEPSVAAAFIQGLSGAFSARVAAADKDLFEAASVQAACAVALLPFASTSTVCSNAIFELAKKVVRSVSQGVMELLDELAISEYALLKSGNGMANFYFLPLRVMSILGWVGAAVHLEKLIGGGSALAKGRAGDLVRIISARYAGSIVPVSDEMAPFYLAFAAAANELGCEDELEAISCLLLRQLHDRGGRLAAPGLGGESALRFLNAVAGNNYAGSENLLANPTSLLPATLLTLDGIGLADLANGAMKGFDHTNMNIFVPFDFGRFGDDLIEGGTNFTFGIGHTIFSVEDLHAEWTKISLELASNATLAPPAVKIGTVLASLLRPNRQPWFLLGTGSQEPATHTAKKNEGEVAHLNAEPWVSHQPMFF